MFEDFCLAQREGDGNWVLVMLALAGSPGEPQPCLASPPSSLAHTPPPHDPAPQAPPHHMHRPALLTRCVRAAAACLQAGLMSSSGMLLYSTLYSPSW